jgi:hypothetical protein
MTINFEGIEKNLLKTYGRNKKDLEFHLDIERLKDQYLTNKVL